MKRFFLSLDLPLVFPVAILVILSLITLFSLNTSFFKGQLSLLIVSIFFFFIFSQADINFFRHFSKQIYIVSIFLLSLVLFLGIESRGAVRWVEILGFRIQFSEIIKPFLALALAFYLSNIKSTSINNFLKVLGLLLPLFILIFLQPDLGNALLISIVVILTLFYYGFSLKYFLALFAPLVILFPVFFSLLHDYQKQRILTFLNPSSDPLGVSYNVIQSTIAVGAGNLIGSGIGLGTQSSLRFLPERQTDFIFATISEQLGFLGFMIMLLCFGFLLYRILKEILESEDSFARIFSAIFFLTLSVQLFLNIGMNMGIVPIVGVTLPFVSYGGSSLLSNFIFLGFFTALLKNNKKKESLSIG